MVNDNKEQVILTTRDEFEYEDYLEYCKDMDIVPADRYSVEYYQWCAEESQLNYEADRENLKCVEIANETFCITGTHGLWWGRPEIVPVMKEGLLNAIDKCNGRDINDIEVKFNLQNGYLDLYAHHHDGTNCYQIHLLNKNGVKWFQNAIDRHENPTTEVY